MRLSWPLLLLLLLWLLLLECLPLSLLNNFSLINVLYHSSVLLRNTRELLHLLFLLLRHVLNVGHLLRQQDHRTILVVILAAGDLLLREERFARLLDDDAADLGLGEVRVAV